MDAHFVVRTGCSVVVLLLDLRDVKSVVKIFGPGGVDGKNASVPQIPPFLDDLER